MKTQPLLVYDSLNKFLLQNLYNQPKIKTITFTLPLKHILKAYDKINTKETDKIVQKLAFLFLYCYFSRKPIIQMKRLVKKSNAFNTFLNININNANEIQALLLSLLLENPLLSKKNTLNIKILSLSNTLVHYEIFCAATFLINAQNLLQLFFESITAKTLYFKLNIRVKGNAFYKLKNARHLLYNTSFFWKIFFQKK